MATPGGAVSLWRNDLPITGEGTCEIVSRVWGRWESPNCHREHGAPLGVRSRGFGSEAEPVSHAEVDAFFTDQVFSFMFTDIQREIDIARENPDRGGGNFLAALGLLCFTEALGLMKLANVPGGSKRADDRFNAFFADLGPKYQQLGQQMDVYRQFRSDFVHRYFAKRQFDVYMFRGSETCGAGEKDGRYFFVVERYYKDFQTAARQLHKSLMALDEPVLPK